MNCFPFTRETAPHFSASSLSTHDDFTTSIIVLSILLYSHGGNIVADINNHFTLLSMTNMKIIFICEYKLAEELVVSKTNATTTVQIVVTMRVALYNIRNR